MHNAVVQAQHEIAVRYDFKGTKASIEFKKQDNALTLLADHKGQLETVIQVLKEKMARRGVPVNALIRGKLEEASHDSVRETLTLHTGIDSEDARKIVKDIKQLKLKVQAQIMDDKVRVTGTRRLTGKVEAAAGVKAVESRARSADLQGDLAGLRARFVLIGQPGRT